MVRRKNEENKLAVAIIGRKRNERMLICSKEIEQ
jgi:hypothetical protein